MFICYSIATKTIFRYNPIAIGLIAMSHLSPLDILLFALPHFYQT